ncbi:MAG TPA: cytochrome c oxidase subunit 3 [Labilithrix sp.]|jgi:cytochrome c oxidase subunit 3
MNEAHEHFAGLEEQESAARLGLWVFLGSEALLFAGLFMLYAALRVEHPHAFHEGVHHATKTLGSINTGVLLVSSGFVAYAVHAIRQGRRALAVGCTSVTIVLGLVFFAIKITEYAKHWSEGIGPGARGAFFTEHADKTLPAFWTLYYTATGLHAVHVLVGITVLAILVLGIVRGKVDERTAYRLECGATYWHLVDLFWIFLWPLFYLA